MRQHSTQQIRTFTIGFENNESNDEVEDARKIARMFDTDHTEMILKAEDYQKYYQRYLWDLEEPLGNESAAAFYFVSLIASKKVKVALNGQGADEPWAGYDRYMGVKFSQYYRLLPSFITSWLSSPPFERMVKNEKIKRALLSLNEPDTLTRFVKIYSFYSTAMKARLFQPWICEQISVDGREASAAIGRLQGDVADLDPLTQMLYIDTRANLPDDLLMVCDKTSMANSLEARVPFLDVRLVEFIETLPANLKLRGFTGKYLHKKACQKWVPREVVHRRKKGFANPVDSWFRSHMRAYVDECLLSDHSAVVRYFDRGYIREIISAHESGSQNYLRQIQLLISFELWHRMFISGNEPGGASNLEAMHSAATLLPAK
jgi:asparagine synthase (glutamine-hydrolysing)